MGSRQAVPPLLAALLLGCWVRPSAVLGTGDPGGCMGGCAGGTLGDKCPGEARWVAEVLPRLTFSILLRIFRPADPRFRDPSYYIAACCLPALFSV